MYVTNYGVYMLIIDIHTKIHTKLEHPQWEFLKESLEGVEFTFLEFVQKRILKIFW